MSNIEFKKSVHPQYYFRFGFLEVAYTSTFFMIGLRSRSRSRSNKHISNVCYFYLTTLNSLYCYGKHNWVRASAC